MPRISVCTNFEDKDKPGFSGENDCLDFCRDCWDEGKPAEIVENYKASQDAVDAALDELESNPDGEEHQPYDDEGRYKCEHCGRALTGKDD